MAEQNMNYLSKHIFETAKDMFYEDDDLAIDSN